MSFAALRSTFCFRYHRPDQRERHDGAALVHGCNVEIHDQLVRSQLKLTWRLAKLAHQLRPDNSVRLSNDVCTVMGAALDRAERYSLQTEEHDTVLTQLHSRNKQIAGLGLSYAAGHAASSREVTQ
jgi:hypothetical protein